MKKFTLEWNAVITLEAEQRPGRAELSQLISMHGTGIDVGIATTAASENNSSHQLPTSAADFYGRLEALGIQNLSKVPTLKVWDLTFWDLARWGGDNSSDLVQELWSLVKPINAIPIDHRKFASQQGFDPDTELNSPKFFKWRNKWCDVYSLEAHIAAGRDVFVSGDVKNFRGEKREKLIALGAGEVCSYEEALEIARGA